MRLYPNNADGDALQRIADKGSDMSEPMTIDFCVAVPDEISGKRIAEVAEQKGYSTEVVQNHDQKEWTCYCVRTMVPRYDDIIRAQAELDELSKAFNGYIDGWGSFGNKDKIQ